MIKNQWYVACASSQLGSSAPTGARVGGRGIALFRDQSGLVHALADRCCHRGLPLSRGVVDDGRLRCGYHGWTYDGAGRCVEIPSLRGHRSTPPRYGVRSYHCDERDGYVWIWVGDEEPGVRAFGAPEAATGHWIQGCRSIRCNYLRALENLFDVCHIVFVHPTNPASMRAKETGLVDSTYELRTTANGCTLITPPSTDAGSQPKFIAEFMLPATVRITHRFGDGRKLTSHFFATPVDDRACRLDWLIADLGAEHDGERFRWEGEGDIIADQDQEILELVQHAYDDEGEGFEHSVEADVPMITVRRIVRAAEQGSWSRPGIEEPGRLLTFSAHPR